MKQDAIGGGDDRQKTKLLFSLNLPASESSEDVLLHLILVKKIEICQGGSSGNSWLIQTTSHLCAADLNDRSVPFWRLPWSLWLGPMTVAIDLLFDERFFPCYVCSVVERNMSMMADWFRDVSGLGPSNNHSSPTIHHDHRYSKLSWIVA